MNCIDRINYGMILRLILTIISFYILIKFNIKTNYLPIILVIKMLILDAVDNSFNIYTKDGFSINDTSDCTLSYHYQSLDKIMDLFTYVLLFLFYDNDKYLLLFVIWRSFGVAFNTITGNRKWLFIFFDFVKEYLLYRYLFGKNNTYMPIFILGKMGFEYYFHIYRIASKRR